MIEVEGYKAFKGTIKIKPKNSVTEPFAINGDWLYKPDTDCWYGCGQSFPKEVCEILTEER